MQRHMESRSGPIDPSLQPRLSALRTRISRLQETLQPMIQADPVGYLTVGIDNIRVQPDGTEVDVAFDFEGDIARLQG